MGGVVMLSVERLVAAGSDYYIHTPSRQAEGMFLYPMQVGRFIYEPGYALWRESFDSFLIMYLQRGSLTLAFEGKVYRAAEGSFVYIDCYKPHEYSSEEGCECLWCHFDGLTARGFYNAVTSRLSYVFTLSDAVPALGKLQMAYGAFKAGGPVREPLLNKYLTDILTAFLLATSNTGGNRDRALMVDELIAFISEHFREDLRVEELAVRANMSLYHFIRVFRQETGFTPHEYIMNVRMATAKYLLKNTGLTVKEICRSVGFSSESVFCSAFKRSFTVTPAQYRKAEQKNLCDVSF